MLFERKLKTAESRLFCFFSDVAEMQGTYELMHNGYRTEWKAILSEIICALFNCERARRVSLIWNRKFHVRPKLHDTKFNGHFIIHFFGIAKFSRPDTNSSKSFLPFSCNLICFLTQALKYDCLLWFSKAVSLAGEEIRSRAPNGAIRE